MFSSSFLADTPSWLMGIGTVVVTIGYGDIKYMILFIRTLQLIIILTGIQIPFPANLITYLQIIHSLSSYDILSYFNMYSLPILNRIQFDNNAVNMLISQMQNIGYNSRNAMIGLGSFTFFIFIYLFRIMFALLMKMICLIFSGRFYT